MEENSLNYGQDNNLPEISSDRDADLRSGKEISVLLEWNLIKYTVKRDDKQEDVLKGVSGFANPKEITAIMGASGAGKTTLLNVLSGRFKNSHDVQISGKVTLNSQDIKSINYGYHSAYVTQDDVLLPSLTVRESLMFSTRLRLPGTKTEHAQRVDKILKDLLLENISENVIGSVTNKGISGGERRRVVIGMELITDPHILILDEPTSGLDSFTAKAIFNLLIAQAEKGRTVVSTVHQPSSSIFEKIDKLILLSEGCTVYQGSAKRSLKYFSNLGFACPKHLNPADYYMRILHVSNRYEKSDKEVKRLEKFLENYNEKQASLRPHNNLLTADLNQVDFEVSFLTKFSLLLKRSALNSLRNPALSRVKFLQVVIISVIIDLIFNNLGTDYRSIQNRNGVLFELTLTAISLGSQNASLAFPSERPIFIKETSQRIYGATPYYVAKSISELPSLILATTLQSVLVY